MAPYAYSMTIVDAKKEADVIINADSPTSTKKIGGFGQYYNMPDNFDKYQPYGNTNYMMRFMKDNKVTKIKVKSIYRTNSGKVKNALRESVR